MNNFILFLNSFLSYILLFLIIVVVAGIAMFIGITMRKKSNAKEAELENMTDAGEEQKAVTE